MEKGTFLSPFQILLHVAFIQITANVINSATATASQIPLTPNHNGRRKKQITGNMIPLKTVNIVASRDFSILM